MLFTIEGIFKDKLFWLVILLIVIATGIWVPFNQAEIKDFLTKYGIVTEFDNLKVFLNKTVTSIKEAVDKIFGSSSGTGK
jgi:hypothetical protein